MEKTEVHEHGSEKPVKLPLFDIGRILGPEGQRDLAVRRPALHALSREDDKIDSD